ncbi:MAG: hypothetical protein HY319_11120 [Armatimonadetes bacterium]|nr:hypothetical protein [Armatimonadota bacterium]
MTWPRAPRRTLACGLYLLKNRSASFRQEVATLFPELDPSELGEQIRDLVVAHARTVAV